MTDAQKRFSLLELHADHPADSTWVPPGLRCSLDEYRSTMESARVCEHARHPPSRLSPSDWRVQRLNALGELVQPYRSRESYIDVAAYAWCAMWARRDGA